MSLRGVQIKENRKAIKSILVFKPSALGDIVHGVQVMRALAPSSRLPHRRVCAFHNLTGCTIDGMSELVRTPGGVLAISAHGRFPDVRRIGDETESCYLSAMIRNLIGAALAALCWPSLSHAEAEPLPLLDTKELRGFSELPEARRKVISIALATADEVAGMPYKYGGNGPEDGGFDCSGAIHYVLHKAGLKPPRTSADQFLWVKENSKLHTVANSAEDTEDDSFAELKPGDLVFWSGTYEPTDNRRVDITHVAIFLGFEKKDGRAVMINATDGRSYRGKKGNGFGVYDFRVPRKGGKSRMVGYGTPPGLAEK